MKNSFGQSVIVTLFGESHGEMIGAVLDGIAPGISVDPAYIAQQLTLRRPVGKTGTKRQESDMFQIVSGVFEGKTTGTPICILIPNENTQSKDYAAVRALARPGHADYTAFCKYHGFEDYRGGGHFSGRLTAALVAAGAIVLDALKQKGIMIGTHLSRCAGVEDRSFDDLYADIRALNEKPFAVLDDDAAAAMRLRIEEASANGDSVGGILDTAIIGVPAGVGEPWFDTVEGVLSHALFSIPAIKGVQFGDGFRIADSNGSTCNDAFRMENDRIVTLTNHNGGVNGGITNGMPIRFQCTVKPTPSIYCPQNTVDMFRHENAVLQIHGRHDPAVLHRARVVVDSVAALALCDQLVMRYGTDWLGGDV